MELLHSVLLVAETIKIKCNVIKLRIQLKCESVLGKVARLRCATVVCLCR